MGIFNSLKRVFEPSLKNANHDLVQIINANSAGQEIPKKIDNASTFLKSTIILPIIAGSQDFIQDKHGKITFQPNAEIHSVSNLIDDWLVFVGFVESEAIQNATLPSLTRFATCRFSDLPLLLETSEADGAAVSLYANKGAIVLAQEQIRRIIDEPRKSFEPVGLIHARENYSDLRNALDLSFNLREQIYRKLESMTEVSGVWIGHLLDRDKPKYFIFFDSPGSSKVFFQELKPLLVPELNGEELIHVRYFDGFSQWITSHLLPFYRNKEMKLPDWGLEKFGKDIRVHSNKRRPSLKKKL